MSKVCPVGILMSVSKVCPLGILMSSGGSPEWYM